MTTKTQNQTVLLSDKIIVVEQGHRQVKKCKPVFKPYVQDQDFLLPKSFGEFIGKGHICRLISSIIDEMDISSIIVKYKGGGASAYQPRMLLKVWILGFVKRVYSSRSLAKELRENLAFIWISGNQTPDFRTLSNFRKDLKKEIKGIFKDVVLLGIKLGIIEGKDVFLDHTKKEANANRHKIVWRKQVEKQSEKIDKELDELFAYIDEVNEKEDRLFGDRDLPEQERKGFDPDKVKEIVDKIDKRIKEENITHDEGKKMKATVRRVAELVERKKSYQNKKMVLGERNSYSRTDTDAVAMMMKDKKIIKPAYNEGIAVENGFVLNYILSNNCSDAVSFKPLMEGVINNLEKSPETATSDGAYGNEENHTYLEEKGISNYLKYNSFYKESQKSWHEKMFRLSDFSYNSLKDEFTCKGNKLLTCTGEFEEKTKTGFVKKVKAYRIQNGNCLQCPYLNKCAGGKTRSLSVSWEAERLKDVARKNLHSAKGKELRSRRANEVESVFGDEKLNNKNGRYLLRGIEKASIEAGLYYLAHNIRKIQARIVNKSIDVKHFFCKKEFSDKMVMFSAKNIINEPTF